jgi:SAM-dependent methyltransferase
MAVTLMASPFTPEMFERMDDSDDALFYASPRKVVHIDEGAIAAASQAIATILPPDSVLLDLMSSWRSHFPADFAKRRLVGLGLNAEEMADNPDLDEHVVHDLNVNPRLPFSDETFDGAVVTVSIQYMTRPLETFAEVARVLKPGAPFLVLYSNRMFPTKAVRIWQSLRDGQRASLIRAYFEHAGEFDAPEFRDFSPHPGIADPLFAVWARRTMTR